MYFCEFLLTGFVFGELIDGAGVAVDVVNTLICFDEFPGFALGGCADDED